MGTAPEPNTTAPATRDLSLIGRLPAGRIALASALAVVASLLVRSLFGLTTPTEIIGDQLTLLMPNALFDAFLAAFDGATKHIYFVGLLFGEAILLWALTLLYARLLARWRAAHPRTSWPDWAQLAVLVVAFEVLAAGILTPLVGGGFFGSALPGGAGQLLISLLVLFVLYAILLRLLAISRDDAIDAAATPSGAQRRMNRRQALRQGATAIGILAVGAIGWEFLSDSLMSLLGTGVANTRYPLMGGTNAGTISPPPVPTYTTWPNIAGQTTEVTPTANFYYVSKNLAGDPQIDAARWTLSIDGLVSTPYSLTYAQLQALPQVQRYQTLECISNDVGGDLMSNAAWTGVSVADLLRHAGPLSSASEMLFTCADGYSDSLHLAQALNPQTLVVYAINGQPLPQPHGYPARLLVPGLYGMKNGKWLTKLTLGPGGYNGYWEQRGWSHEAVVHLMSRIDTPHNQDLLATGTLSIAGVAFAGAAGISEVQVSLDGGTTWHATNLRRPLGNLTWVLWEYPWQAKRGQYVIATRAVDVKGNIQTPATEPPIPNGATGYDAVAVTVR